MCIVTVQPLQRAIRVINGFLETSTFNSLVLGRELRSWVYLKSLHDRELRSSPSVSKHILVLVGWFWIVLFVSKTQKEHKEWNCWKE